MFPKSVCANHAWIHVGKVGTYEELVTLAAWIITGHCNHVIGSDEIYLWEKCFRIVGCVALCRQSLLSLPSVVCKVGMGTYFRFTSLTC